MTDLTYTNEWTCQIWTHTSPLCIPLRYWDPGDHEISYCMNRTNGVSREICKMHINR